MTAHQGDDLIETITSVINYGDIDELCDTMNVDEYWFSKYFAWDEVVERYYFLNDDAEYLTRYDDKY